MRLHGKEDKVNISTQSTTLLDMLNSSSSTGKSKSAADSYIDVLIQNNNLRYQQKMKEVLGDKVFDVRPSKRLKKHPVCFASDGDISIEMEKILSQMPNNQEVKADKVLEVNIDHKVFGALKSALIDNPDDFALFTKLLYDQARLIEGLSIDDPVEFSDNIWKLMK